MITFAVIALTFGYRTASSQDATFSQFYNNPTYFNPAFTGSNLGLKSRLNYRSQWNSLSNSYKNYTFSIDAAEPNLPGAGGIGLIINSDLDGLGQIKTTSASLLMSAKISFSDDFYSMLGIGASFASKTLDGDDLIFSDQLDPRNGIYQESIFNTGDLAEKVNYTDFSTGLLLRYCESSQYFENIVSTLAISVQHVFEPNISFTNDADGKLPLKLVLMGDVLFGNDSRNTSYNRSRSNSNSDLKLNPAFMYERQGDLTDFSIGLNAYKSYIYTGLWLRSQNFTMTNVKDMIVMVGFTFPFIANSTFKCQYSYDYVLTDMRRAVGATHEISIVYELPGFSFLGSGGGRYGAYGDRRGKCTECESF